MKTFLHRSLRAGPVVMAVVALLLVFLTNHAVQGLLDDNRWVVRTIQARDGAENIRQLLLEESSARFAWRTTGEDAHRLVMEQAGRAAIRNLASVRALTSDSPAQQARLRELEPLVRQRLEVSARRDTLPRQTNSPTSVGRELQREGIRLNGEISAVVAAIVLEEDALLASRTSASERSALITVGIVATVSVLSIVGILGAAGMLRRELQVREQAETSLRQGEERFRSLLESAPDAMVVADEAGRIVLVNAQVEKLFGWTRAALVGQKVEVLVPDHLKAAHVAQREGYAADRSARPMGAGRELNVRRRDGSEFPAEISLSPLRTDEGMLVTAAIRDLTGRKQAEQALHDSEARFHTLWEISQDAMRLLDEKGILITVNEAFCRLVGLRREELEGQPFTVAYAGDRDPAELMRRYQERFRERRIAAQEERRMVLQGGRTVDLEMTSTFIELPGRPTLLLGVLRDITERKQAEQLVRESAAAVSMIFRASPAAISISTVESGRLIEMNERCCEFYGYQREELVGRTIPELNLWAEPEARLAAVQRVVQEGKIHNLEARHRRKSGEERDVLVSMELIDLAGETEPVLIAMFTDITERKQAEAHGRASAALYHSLVDTIPLAVFRKDMAGRLVFGNTRFCHALGRPWEQLAGRTDRDLFPPELAAKYTGDDARMLASGANLELDEENLGADGVTHHVHVIKSPVRNSEGEIIGVQGIFEDVTARHQAEAALRESERRFRQLVHTLPVAVYACDAGGHITLYNEAAVALWGREPEMGRDLWCGAWKTFNPDGSPLALEDSPMAVTLRGGRPVRGREMVIERPDGTRAHVLPHPVATRDITGTLTGGVNMLVDLTERLKAGEALARERRLLRTVIDNLPGYIFAKDAAGRYTVSNLAHGRLLKVASEAELLGKTAFDFFPPETAQRFAEDDRGLLQTGQPVLDREECSEVNGARAWHQLSKMPLRDEHGGIVGLVGIKQDITAHKQAEESLRQAEAKFRAIFDNAVEGIVQTDPSGRIITANPTMARLLGFETPEALLAAALNMDRDVYAKSGDQTSLLRRARTGERDFIQCQFKRRDGQLIWISMNLRVVRDERGEAQFFEGTCVDITEHKQMEEQLRQSQKMEAIGLLAGGIAHDFNNILGAILGNVELIRLMPENDPGRQESLDAILSASQRAADLVKQILAFSRRHEQEREPIQLQIVIREALKLLRATVPAEIVFKTNLARTRTVLADASQIHQIVMNLCTNAAHAMKDRPGVLQVELSEMELDADFARTHTDISPGRYVRLEVTDTGSGMDRATVARMFEPFFTTKAPGEGTGLGLSVVHGIVKSHDGAITVQSEPGVGTTFHLYFPAFEVEAAEPVGESSPLPCGNGEHILFVDDEEPLARLGETILKRLNYRVTAITNSTEALALFLEKPDQFDLVITDLNMPVMNGVNFARQLLLIRPQVAIILTTGYSATLTPEVAREMGFRTMLPKPSNFRILGETVQRVLTEANPD
ncbi:MAG: PAS domain S-box protein [Verrucomicrobia bacterium]|nr:PAS domain S-box protein [Verrucomicrobiota bacterium]